MQAFDVLCRVAGLTPTMSLFLHFYKTRPTVSKGWVSFLGANKSLLTLYLASYKGFKTGFFKVVSPRKGRRYIFDEQDRPKFPLYWTAFPPPTDAWPEERLTPAERADLAVLKTLPDKIPPRPLIQCLRSPDLPGAVYDIMARTTAANAEFLARAKTRRRGEDTAEEAVPLTTVPAAPSTGRVPPAAHAGTSGAASRPRFVVKPPGSGAAAVAAAAGDKGKKSKKDDSPTGRPLKKQKKGETSGSLADAFLGGGVRLDDEVFLQLGPRMTEALKDVSEEDALRTAGELTLRLAALYTKFPRPERSRIEDLEKELAAAKTELNEGPRAYWKNLFTLRYPSPLQCLRRSVAAVLSINRWAPEVRESIAVVLPMNRWALKVRGSTTVVLPMNRWALKVRGSTDVVLPMNQWALKVRGSTAVVLPMHRWALKVRGTDGPLRIIFGRLTDGTYSTQAPPASSDGNEAKRFYQDRGKNVFKRVGFRGSVGWSGGAGSVSALFESSESGTSLGGVSNTTSSPILLSGSSEAKLPVVEAAEQVAISDESGDIIGIDVDDEGDAVDLPEISGYDWAPYEPRTLATRFDGATTWGIWSSGPGYSARK
ncbi:hypothetical protein DEO72_LG5g2628 [Vigna unguiculata]|uniref:Uncharacterized protein n=1 Tax=Vigna unguiculata TaxID=3917 RepID=A0A4D6M3B3_VIGUN|nr:hypothetical protein DEO72_LG5g2628 [Vigna unguiculata]